MKKTLKKLTIVALILTIALGVFALTGCESFDLAKYKTEAKGKIDTHAATKAEANYTPENWTVLLQAVAEGKSAVNNATTKQQVDTAVNTANEEIDKVEKKVEKRVVSIHFVITQSFKAYQDHKFFDFAEMTYSTKRIITDEEWGGEQEEYVIITTFTKEQAITFFKNIKELGIFDLEKNYSDDVFDGLDWSLTITFSDGTAFESGGYAKYPEKEDAINEAFLLLTGYALFSSIQ